MRRASLARCHAKAPDLTQKAGIAFRIKERVETQAAIAAAPIEPVDDSLHIRLLLGRQICGEILQVKDEDIKVTDGAQGTGDIAQATFDNGDRTGSIIVRDQFHEAAHTADGYPHPVHGFDVFASAAAGFVAFHSANLLGEDFAAGFGHSIGSVNHTLAG